MGWCDDDAAADDDDDESGDGDGEAKRTEFPDVEPLRFLVLELPSGNLT